MHHKKNFQSSVINRHFESVTDLQCLHFVVFICNVLVNQMCPRPYPVYVKMRAKANKIKKLCELCVCVLYTVFFVLKKQSSNLWT